jgi:hypothetical protein
VRLIRFEPLEFTSTSVLVRWSEEPVSGLYQRPYFTLDFGPALDPRTLPQKLWWTIVLLCLHSHWNFLRPCRVVFPIHLPEGELEFWQRILQAERFSLEAYRGTRDPARSIELEARGPDPGPVELPPDTGRSATAFSGGKESLLQAGILCQFTSRPLLVNTQAEMPPMVDHSSRIRAHVMREMVRRRNGEVVEVKSDLRANWNNLFSHTMGYRQSVNEMSDAYLYVASLLAVSASRGARRLCLGCEFEAQRCGLTLPDGYAPFFSMMSVPVIQSLSRLLRPWGMELGSLLWPLSQYQIMSLLWRRYPDIADLQCSCWSIQDPNVGYCSLCLKCLKIATILISLDVDPARLEMDVTALFLKGARWGTDELPTGGALTHAAQRISPRSARRFFPEQNWRQRLGFQKPPAYRALLDLIAQSRGKNEEWVGQYRPAYAKYIPPSLRQDADRLYRECFPVLDPADYSEDIARADAQVGYITETL